MSTPNRTEINRENAQHSTGPVTEAGKKKVSLNAIRHGLTSQIVVLPSEDVQAYQAHLKSFLDEYHPQGPTEATLVQALADASWRLSRAAAMETNLLTLGAVLQPDASTSQAQHAMAMVAALESHTKSLANLSMLTQRLSRQFEKTVTQLRDLQKTRRAQEQTDLNNLLAVMEMSKSKGETYDPAQDGFVFSEPQIAAARRARNRDRRIAEAQKYRPAAA
jgi:hypothetical protein